MKNQKLAVSMFFSLVITAFLISNLAFTAHRKKMERAKNTPLSHSESVANATPETLEESTIEVSTPENNLRPSKKGLKMIEKQLIKPVQAKINIPIDTKVYSRCPSGLHYRFVDKPSEGKPYHHGIVFYSRGCKKSIIAHFYLDTQEKRLQVREEGTERFIPVKNWLASLTEEDLSRLASSSFRNKYKKS